MMQCFSLLHVFLECLQIDLHILLQVLTLIIFLVKFFFHSILFAGKLLHLTGQIFQFLLGDFQFFSLILDNFLESIKFSLVHVSHVVFSLLNFHLLFIYHLFISLFKVIPFKFKTLQQIELLFSEFFLQTLLLTFKLLFKVLDLLSMFVF